MGTRISINSRPIWKNENPDELAKLKLKPPEKKAKPPLLSQTRTSTSEVTNRKPTAGTVSSAIFTLKCTETSCKKGNIQKKTINNNRKTTIHNHPIILHSFLLLFYWILPFEFLTSDFWIFKDFLRIFHGFFKDFSRINK